MSSFFVDSPEYKARLAKPYELPKVTLKQIHEGVPKELYKKSTVIGVYYAVRDFALAYSLFTLAKQIDPITKLLPSYGFSSSATYAAGWAMWCTYWLFQSLTGAALFTLGHEAGHGNLSEYHAVNYTIGYLTHTAIFTPFYAWRYSHNIHHKNTGSMERDENYIPKTRKQRGLPPKETMSRVDYLELLDDTPIMTLWRLFRLQIMGWNLYLTFNLLSNEHWPEGTNHWSPWSPLFRKQDRNGVIATDIGLLTWLAILTTWGYNTSAGTVWKYYVIPYIFTNHWNVMCTYLQHTDPTMPHFRNGAWTFLRGAATTVDRPFLGWIGRFFFHNISHDHVAHHFFSSIPFYNGPQLTEHLKKVMGEDYNYDSTNTWYALWRSFNNCQFVENEGDIIMYKNRAGEQMRAVAGQED
ncbi:hypothetical protein DL93DRAFT_1332737 [Clavulina sp. PMI_390]|nr:hypothetical protein DL93DRAFT_1332737 [Clavulina sp. PMI_390]